MGVHVARNPVVEGCRRLLALARPNQTRLAQMILYQLLETQDPILYVLMALPILLSIGSLEWNLMFPPESSLSGVFWSLVSCHC